MTAGKGHQGIDIHARAPGNSGARIVACRGVGRKKRPPGGGLAVCRGGVRPEMPGPVRGRRQRPCQKSGNPLTTHQRLDAAS